jgi:predicted nucleotidyltransferase component of viral defense system
VLDLDEIVAGKLVALVDRYAARDLLDVCRVMAIDVCRSRLWSLRPLRLAHSVA